VKRHAIAQNDTLGRHSDIARARSDAERESGSKSCGDFAAGSDDVMRRECGSAAV